MESWQPNKLVQDDEDVAYEPTDEEGQRLAGWLTMKLRIIMFRAKNAPPLDRDAYDPGKPIMCRCTLKPVYHRPEK